MNKKSLLLTVLSLLFLVNANAFKVYIFADMEGCSMLVNRDQLLSKEGPQRMTEDINACIDGCFAAGATEVIVRDGHSNGINVDPKAIDPRAQLVQGATPGIRFEGIEGSKAVILLGYHAMAQTKNAIMAHSYDSKNIQMMYLNGMPIGEIGVDAIIAGEHGVPVVLVTGDDKTMKEAKKWIPGVVTCEVKKGTSHLTGKCMPADEAHALIKKKTIEALGKKDSIKPVKTSYPATMKWDYIPEGSPRVYMPGFVPTPDPKTKVAISNDSVEGLLLKQ